MFGKKPRHSGNAGALRKLIEWSIAFAQADRLPIIFERGQQIAKSPHPAEIDGLRRKLAISPGRFQLVRVRLGLFPAGIRDFEQIPAARAAEILPGAAAQLTASDAAELEIRLPHPRRGR